MSTAPDSRTQTVIDELPSNWTWVAVERLAVDRAGALTDGPFGSNLKTSHYTESGPRVIRLQNIGDGVFHDEKAHISREHFERLRKHEAVAQDVVVAMLGEKLPRACLVPDYVGPAIVKADCARLRVDPRLARPSLVAAGLNCQSLRCQADELIHGVGRPRLGLRWLKTLQFPLAPLPEQRRIVEAIESYFTRLDDAVATLERLQRNLKRYRASVLKAAVEGRLVPTEAELARAEGRDYEPASMLLERILAERHHGWQEAGGRATYEEPVTPDTTGLPKLPEGWCWASPDELAALEEYSLGIGPFGSNLKVSDYRDEGVPLIFVRNIRTETFGGSQTKFVSPGKADALTPHVAKGGDVLITKMGEPPGDACLYPAGSPNAVITADCIRWRLHHALEARGYFVAAILSSLVRAQIVGITRGVAQKKISLARFKTTAIPLPPMREQVRVAGEVERLLSIGDGAMIELRRQAARCSRLRQSILKWAFEGRLADQDPRDEPAATLLERIRSQTLASGLSAGDTGDRRRRRTGTRRSVRAENKP